MKYLVFALAAFGVFPLSFLLANNLKWARYVFLALALSLCFFHSSSINFFSNETYSGTSRGMEVSLVYLLAFAFLLALFFRGRSWRCLPDAGFWIYVLYFLLCLPSLTAADDLLISWFEIWKMVMMSVVFLAAFQYLSATGDVTSFLNVFTLVVLVNFVPVVSQHYSNRYQAHGIFPHWNCMAMALHLTGTLFFAYYLQHGVRSLLGKIFFISFVCSVIATLWSYSRGAFAVMPICYAMTFFACILERRHTRSKLKRVLPLVLVAILGTLVILPRIITRFVTAPKASGDTRVELAYCAWEMIKDEPLRGVGINNWSLKMEPSHPYQDRAGAALGYDLDYRGIVETVYLLVGAECGIPALLAMLAWFGWYWVSCLRLLRKLNGTRWYYLPAGLLGGLTANYLQSVLEWVLRQQMNLICLMFVFAILSYLNTSWAKLKNMETKAHFPCL